MKFLTITQRILNKIAAIERLAYNRKGWKITKFKDYLGEQGILARFLESDDGEIMGYFVCEDTTDEINILNLTCNPKFNQEEVFKKILDHLRAKTVSLDNPRVLRMTVRDDRLSLQKFLHAYGMKGKLLRKFFANGQDGVTFILKGGDEHA